MIKLLHTGHLISTLPAPRTSTNSNHRACLIADEHGESVKTHLKAFPSRSNGLVNEIAGHILHQAAGITTAPRAWVIILSSQELTGLFPHAKWGKDRLWPCWATEHLDGTPVNAGSAWTWADELAIWPDTPACIALHEWLWNIDGNAGNLISTGRGELAAIDHADILGGDDWTTKTLRDNTHTRFYNKALHIAWGGTPDPAQRLAARQAATQHGAILARSWQHIRHWWQSLLKEKDMAAAHAFLTARAAPDWIMNRL